jgi:hypothetical protein
MMVLICESTFNIRFCNIRSGDIRVALKRDLAILKKLTAVAVALGIGVWGLAAESARQNGSKSAAKSSIPGVI